MNDDFCEILRIENIIDKKKLEEQIKNGWEILTEAYKDDHVIVHKNDHGGDFITKFKHMNTIDEELVLGILGVIRKHIIKKMFKCIVSQPKYKNFNHTYNAAGSTNITSDYDLSISGPYSNEIMWKMFLLFLNSWGEAIPHSFDTNIYTGATSYYIQGTIRDNDKRIQQFENHDGEKLFLMVPISDKDKENLFTWACVKLIEAGIEPTDKKNTLNKLLNKAKALKNALNTKYCNGDIKIKDETGEEIDIGGFDDATAKIIKNYYLQYLFGKPVEDYLHGRETITGKLINPQPINNIDENENNLFYLRGLNNFFSSEAYYTDATVYAIVLEEQLHYHTLNLNAETYLAAAIENLGDFIHHIHKAMKEGDDENKKKKILIKFSKYLYRFNLMVGHYYQTKGDSDNKFIRNAHDINKYVIPLRATYVIHGMKAKKAFEILKYKLGLKEYVKKIKKEYLSIINEMMSNKEEEKTEGGGLEKKFKKKFKKAVNKLLRKKQKKKTIKNKKTRKNRTFKNNKKVR
ncbi:MAG: hypothetical protein CML42_00560 [Rhodobacteraceae bacterium]|nr:hypothetical protein [Paracoccaceae bacterium]|tara:strand:- start:3167 stop:4720 length:1554 start_codon:yes stop_codon:yes gene_type:complete